jgi:hypothetical protein
MDYLSITAMIGWIFTSILLYVKDVSHAKERKDLYNRLMARDYVEYTKHDEGKKKPKRSNNPLKDQMEKSLKNLARGDD